MKFDHSLIPFKAIYPHAMATFARSEYIEGLNLDELSGHIYVVKSKYTPVQKYSQPVFNTARDVKMGISKESDSFICTFSFTIDAV